MLKIKDNVPVDRLQDYNFITTNLNHNGIAELWEGGIIKMWVDKNRLIHFNAPRYAQLDLIYAMHDLIEYTDEYWNNKMLSRPVLQEKVKELTQEVNSLKNIVRNFEDWLDEQIDINEDSDNQDYLCAIYSIAYCKLQEIKERK